VSTIDCFLVEMGDDHLFHRGADTYTLESLPSGAMYFADWYQRKGPDGHHLIVKTPGGIWHVDGRANNCTRPDDTAHHCWVRHGDAPDVTVDKNGDTCGCGCSIGQGPGWRDYHGFLRNGRLESC